MGSTEHHLCLAVSSNANGLGVGITPRRPYPPRLRASDRWESDAR